MSYMNTRRYFSASMISASRRASRSCCNIARMPEVVGTFLRTEARQERANGPAQPRHCSLGSFAQEGLEFAERHLDGIEVGRVLRQVAKRRPRTLDCLTDGCSFVNIDVVHDDDIVAPERGDQTLLDVGPEHLCVHGAFDHHWGDHFVVTQGGHEGDRLPISARGSPDQLDAARTATIDPYHVGGDRSLVDKHQPSRIKHALLPNPASARLGHVGAVLFLSAQTLFFCR